MLSANQIVTGSVGKFGERFVITAKLIDVETAQSVNASSRAYSSLNELLEETGSLVRKLLEVGADSPSHTPTIQRTTPVTLAGAGSDMAAAFEVPMAAIRLDGRTEDWLHVPPLFDDSIADDSATSEQPGTDIAKGFLARELEYLYVLFLLADGRPNSSLGPSRYTEYNLHLANPSYLVYIRLQTRHDDKQWKAELTRYDKGTGAFTVLASGALKIRGNCFEARYPLARIADHVDLRSSLLVSADIGFSNEGTWVTTDQTAPALVRVNP